MMMMITVIVVMMVMSTPVTVTVAMIMVVMRVVGYHAGWQHNRDASEQQTESDGFQMMHVFLGGYLKPCESDRRPCRPPAARPPFRRID